ncbi:hypothetical protein Ssi03_76390 [Sphaerisporangium siamense]|uniref:Uncharacterized protein n=1 Tax=Sphaerisporangium siamense TaxID=795645 RepID=A0A7W7D4T0_9ACTN|nr:hypothetical protein [Sphaerisporangium siamense]MBB4699320.1 hypothetical protein [Sphaerisporangium siamense]GII89649.1 hypothetical protein Ssi03_76390 [Sphaerisporangium siamense]
METVVTALAVALVGVLCLAGAYRSHAKALTLMVTEAHAERRAEVERNHALRSEITAETLRRAEQLTHITDRVRTINGRKP